jgi:uncharacterized protein YceK
MGKKMRLFLLALLINLLFISGCSKVTRENYGKLEMGMEMRLLFLLALLINLLFISGCSKVTRENYGKLEMGMEYSEVTILLGNPSSCTESIGVKSCIWGNETKNIKINFLGDQTVVFSSTGLK